LAKVLDVNTRELLKTAYDSNNPTPLVAVNTLEVDPASNQRAIELIEWVNAAATEEERARRLEEAKNDSQLRRLATEVIGNTVNLTVDGREYQGLVVDVAQVGHGLEMLGLLPQDEVGIGTKFTVDIVNSDFAKRMGVTYDDKGTPQYGIAGVTLEVEQQESLSLADRVKNSFAKIIASVPLPGYDVVAPDADRYFTGQEVARTEEIDREPEEEEKQQDVDYDDFVFFGESRQTEVQEEVAKEEISVGDLTGGTGEKEELSGGYGEAPFIVPRETQEELPPGIWRWEEKEQVQQEQEKTERDRQNLLSIIADRYSAITQGEHSYENQLEEIGIGEDTVLTLPADTTASYKVEEVGADGFVTLTRQSTYGTTQTVVMHTDQLLGSEPKFPPPKLSQDTISGTGQPAPQPSFSA